MAERIPTRTRGADAPLSTAKNRMPRRGRSGVTDEDDVLVGRTVTIYRPRQELYDFWRDFRNLPLFMENIESVECRWTATFALGGARAGRRDRGVGLAASPKTIPGEVIAWRSVEGASVDNSGRVEFRDSPNGARHRSSARPSRTTRRAASSARCSRRYFSASRTSRRARICGASSSSWKPARSPTSATRPSRRAGRLTGESHARTDLAGKARRSCRDRSGSADPESARRHHPHHLHRDLRLGPASVRSLHPGHEGWRHPRPRVHGRSGRGWRPATRSSRWASAWSCRS